MSKHLPSWLGLEAETFLFSLPLRTLTIVLNNEDVTHPSFNEAITL